MATAKTEDGVVIGNVDDKYGTENPIMRRLMRGFTNTLDALVAQTQAIDIHEIGCGEGHLSRHLAANDLNVRACDFSREIIATARSMTKDVNVQYEIKSIFDLDPALDSAPLIICCEVMEHLEQPEEAMRMLASVATEWCILSVPREPIWRGLNMARCKYLFSLGNTPGHLQHWSKGGFVNLVRRHFDIIEVRSPLPWTFVLCKKR